MGSSASKDMADANVPEDQLWRVSEKVMPGLQDRLGETLGLRIDEVNAIRQSSELSCVNEATLRLLMTWQERQKSGNRFETLIEVVKGLDIWEKGLIQPVKDPVHIKYVVLSKNAKPLTDIQLQCVANRIPGERYVPVGLYLGLPYQSVAADWTASKAHVKTAAFRMLSHWQREVGTNANVNQAATLAKVLEATHQLKLAEEVHRGIGLKVNHYDTRKLNLQAEKLNKYLGLDGSGRLCLANESEDKVEKDRYVVELHTYNTSKTDKVIGSPIMICLPSSTCMMVDKDGHLVAQQESSVKVRQIGQADHRFFLYQTQEDGSSTLRTYAVEKFVCADETGSAPVLGEEGSAIRFRELPCKRR